MREEGYDVFFRVIILIKQNFSNIDRISFFFFLTGKDYGKHVANGL